MVITWFSSLIELMSMVSKLMTHGPNLTCRGQITGPLTHLCPPSCSVEILTPPHCEEGGRPGGFLNSIFLHSPPDSMWISLDPCWQAHQHSSGEKRRPVRLRGYIPLKAIYNKSSPSHDLPTPLTPSYLFLPISPFILPSYYPFQPPLSSYLLQ